MSKKPPAIDFDNNWKEVIEKHVEKCPNLSLDWAFFYHRIKVTSPLKNKTSSLSKTTSK